MKRIITAIICILLSLYGLEAYAQKTSIQERDRNTMGTITSKEFSIRVDETASYADFSIKVPEGGDYYVSFWLLPAQLPDHSYTEFKVYVNGERVGVIHPSKSNWQNASLDNDQTISLKPGENMITLSTALPDVVSTELVSIAKTAQRARISEDEYQDYLYKIDCVDKGLSSSQEIIAQEESEYLAQYGDAAIPYLAEDGSDWEISFFHSLPVKYSFYKTVYYEEGDELRIITNSRDPHVIDVFYTEGGGLSRYNPAYQHLSWLVPSELSSNNQQKIYISFKEIRIPKTGYYTIKTRSLVNEKLGSINIYIDNGYFDNQPLFTAHKSLTMPVDGRKHILMTQRQNDTDPILYVEGAGSCPGRIVAYNDDKRPFIGSDTVINYMFPTHTLDAVIKAQYDMSTCGFHVQNWRTSSTSQAGFCNVIYLKAKPLYIIYPPIIIPQNAVNEEANVLSVSVRNEYGTLQIEANKDVSALSVYDKMGVLISTKVIEAKSTTIPINELNVTSQDIYTLVFYGIDGEVCSKKMLL